MLNNPDESVSNDGTEIVPKIINYYMKQILDVSDGCDNQLWELECAVTDLMKLWP